MSPQIQSLLQRGLVIPACPLALNAQRKLDERRQRALVRYYNAAGAGGLAVGVHTTQFAIRDPGIALLRPVLALAQEEMDRADARRAEPMVRIAGVCGRTPAAIQEAELAKSVGYQIALVSLAGWTEASLADLLGHCRTIATIMPVMGFYLQPAVGGRVLPYDFWRGLMEITNVLAVKIAPFNRYQTLEVVRAVVESGRDDVALYTGNDDNIVMDLLTPFCFRRNGQIIRRRIVGGLLGHWAVWTQKAVELLAECHQCIASCGPVPAELLSRSLEVTDANAAFFDAPNHFAGCIAGLHEVLRRQGLLEGIWLLDPNERLSPGQAETIDRVYAAYPHLHDDSFVATHRQEWLSG